MAVLLITVILFVTLAIANDCSIAPIYVDIHTRAAGGGASWQYGTFIGIGTPSQNLSLWPSLLHNETTIGDPDFCQQSSALNCTTRTHGFYANQLSPTYHSTSGYNSLDGEFNESSSTVAETGTDTLNIFSHYFDPSPPNVTQVEDFPVTVLSNYSLSSNPWFGPAGLLGLGPSSTLLQRLYDQGKIASRSWSLYLGTGYERAGGEFNGSLVLGGYDSGRFSENPVQFQTSSSPFDASPFKVQIQNMSLINSHTNEVTQLVELPFDAYITTSQYDLSLPVDVTQKFINTTEASPAENDDNSLALPNDFQGNLTIELNNGLTIRLPAEWLKNQSNISPISASPLNSNNTISNATNTPPSTYLLGSSILSHLYLMTNYDSNPPSFFLVDANLEAPYVMTQSFCVDTIPQPAKPININRFASAGLTGAIIAGVIGGIGLTFLGWWAIRKYLLYRHSRSRQNKQFEESTTKLDKQKSRSDSVSETSSYNSNAQYDEEMELSSFKTTTFNLPNHDRSDIPFTPRTPMPLLGNSSTERKLSSTRNLQPTHKKLNLDIQTDFLPPPTSATSKHKLKKDRVTRAVGSDVQQNNNQTKDTKIIRHPASNNQHKILRKIFPPP